MSVHQVLLIIAPPGPFRDGLRVLLQAEPRIVHVLLADTIADGSRSITQQLPDGLIIDTDLSDPAMWSFCTRLKTRSPAVHCVVIIHNQDQQTAAQKLALPTLLVGFTAEALFAAILGEPGATGPAH